MYLFAFVCFVFFSSVITLRVYPHDISSYIIQILFIVTYTVAITTLQCQYGNLENLLLLKTTEHNKTWKRRIILRIWYAVRDELRVLLYVWSVMSSNQHVLTDFSGYRPNCNSIFSVLWSDDQTWDQSACASADSHVYLRAAGYIGPLGSHLPPGE